MSRDVTGFRGLSIKAVQERFFLSRLPAAKGRFRYPSTGLNSPPGTVVLFQFQASAVACAELLRDERFDEPKGGYAGALWFEPGSIRTFDPWDAETMRRVWPGFARFGHAKFNLNPGQWPTFLKLMNNVRSPVSM